MSELPPPAPDTLVVSYLSDPPDVPDDPEASGVPETRAFRAPRPGDLSPAWRAMTIATWVGVFLAFAGVWKASDEIGIGTWWLGSRSNPTFVLVRLIPFALAATVVLAATYNLRRLAWLSIAGALAVAVIGAFDFRWAVGLALTELLVAAGALLVGLGSLTGQYRAGAPPTGHESPR